MARAHIVRLAITLAGLSILTACEEGQEFSLFGGDKPETAGDEMAAMAGEGEVIERDVEAPEVFSRTEAGLWDGRPSLGGVWVAHPEVGEPERVMIRNEDNGNFVIGALFRRERENPGPRFQVSSDAAAALNMLAGSPAELTVIALRREVVPVAPPAPAEDAMPTPEADVTEVQPSEAPATIEQKKLDPVAAIAATAIEEATAASGQAAAAAAPAAPAAPAPRPLGNLDKPYVQIGIFSVESNANRTADMLRKAGMVPTIRKSTLQDKPYWRVIVGPAPNKVQLSELIAKARELGFADAYAVSG